MPVYVYVMYTESGRVYVDFVYVDFVYVYFVYCILKVPSIRILRKYTVYAVTWQ